MITDHGIAAALRGLNDAELRLVEANHRIANELAAAIAALRIAGAASHEVRDACIETAVARLEACAQVHSLMSATGDGDAPLGEMLETLCASVARSHLDGCGIPLTLLAHDVGGVRLEPAEAQRVGAIVCELVTNAIKHSPPAADAAIEVRVVRIGFELRILVTGRRTIAVPIATIASRGGGYGRPILSELVRRIGGTVITDIGEDFHRVDVRLPDMVHPAGATRRSAAER